MKAESRTIPKEQYFHRVPSTKTTEYPLVSFCSKVSGLPMQSLSLAIPLSRSGSSLNFFLLAEEQV